MNLCIAIVRMPLPMPRQTIGFEACRAYVETVDCAVYAQIQKVRQRAPSLPTFIFDKRAIIGPPADRHLKSASLEGR